MREIKFRGKSIKINEWHYGSLIVDAWGDSNNKTIYSILSERTAPSFVEIWFPERVDENTISQFTGLCDKNGKEIYEGDIVHCWDTIAKCEIWAVVEFGNPNAEYTWGWQLRKIKGSKGVNLDILCWVECEETNAYCEIIGNIYDNPELLKGE